MQSKMKHLSHLHSKTGTSSSLSSLSPLRPFFTSCFHLIPFLTRYSFLLLFHTLYLTPPYSLTLSFIIINLPSGKLGRPVIQIEGVTFGYASKNESKYPSLPLFADVHLGIEQSSRIALVGPNGSGKVHSTYIMMVLDNRI